MSHNEILHHITIEAVSARVQNASVDSKTQDISGGQPCPHDPRGTRAGADPEMLGDN
jgi:hypothetical protein